MLKLVQMDDDIKYLNDFMLADGVLDREQRRSFYLFHNSIGVCFPDPRKRQNHL